MTERPPRLAAGSDTPINPAVPSASGRPGIVLAVTLFGALVLLAAAMPLSVLRGPLALVAIHRFALASAGISALIGAIVVYMLVKA